MTHLNVPDPPNGSKTVVDVGAIGALSAGGQSTGLAYGATQNPQPEPRHRRPCHKPCHTLSPAHPPSLEPNRELHTLNPDPQAETRNPKAQTPHTIPPSYTVWFGSGEDGRLSLSRA